MGLQFKEYLFIVLYRGVEKRYLTRLITLGPTFDSWPRNTSARDMPTYVIIRKYVNMSA